MGQFELVEKVNELASGPDGLKREALAEAYKLDLVEDKDKLDILEKFFVVGTTYRRDMANVESLRVMPMVGCCLGRLQVRERAYKCTNGSTDAGTVH